MEEGSEFSLKEWGMINTHSLSRRRFSASHIRTSFREDIKSNITFSSTSSSPAYSKEEIDPSTYSFSSALKALQAKSRSNGFALNPKWNDAEKYICNPLSGEVPLECLSAKTLSARSFRNYTDIVTVSSSTSRHFQPNLGYATPSTSSSTVTQDTDVPTLLSLQGKKVEATTTRDVGVQSTMPEPSSSTPSPASTPQIEERSFKQYQSQDSPDLTSKLQNMEVEEDEMKATKREEEREKEEGRRRGSRQGGCFSWVSKRMREKHKSRKNNNIHSVADVKGAVCEKERELC